MCRDSEPVCPVCTGPMTVKKYPAYRSDVFITVHECRYCDHVEWPEHSKQEATDES